MKKFQLLSLIVIAALALGFNSCGTGAAEESLKQENDSLRNVIVNLESSVDGYFKEMNEIADNIDRMKSIEGYLDHQSNIDGISTDPSQRIQDNLDVLNKLMEENNEKIKNLNKKLQNSGIKMSSLQKQIAKLTSDNEALASEIVNVKKRLEEQNLIIASQADSINSMIDKNDALAAQNEETTNKLIQTTDELYEAYYVMGTSKELKAQGIVPKGIGGSRKVLTQDFNKDHFIKIDIRKENQINTYAKRAKVLTTHPANSYVLEKVDDTYTIRITDYKSFWSVSKYLVIEID